MRPAIPSDPPPPLSPDAVPGFVLSPCRRVDGDPDALAVCRPGEAELWTVYALRRRDGVIVAEALVDAAVLADAALVLLLCGRGGGRPVGYRDAAFRTDETDPAALVAALSAAAVGPDPALAPVRDALRDALALFATDEG